VGPVAARVALSTMELLDIFCDESLLESLTQRQEPK
jgi:hypothetical protein